VIIQKELNDNNESNKDITLIVGSLKLKKIELVIQKATELGVNKIIVLQMERSIASYKENFKKKLER
jgi:16S rRNA (uracil1498-N3)-methyltransferase